MKHFIESNLRRYPGVCKSPEDCLVHMFTVNGNGVDLDNKGFLEGNYRDSNPFKFGEPVPLKYLYPWSNDERYQPFRDLAGCRDVGFLEAAQHFLDCLSITPDTVKDATDWKSNIETIRAVLMETPAISDPYEVDDLDKFLNDVKAEVNTSLVPMPQSETKSDPRNSVYKIWYFDVQWSDCPKSVEKEVSYLWQSRGFGNDNYIYKGKLDGELFENYPRIYFWLKGKGVEEDESFIMNWWW